MNKIVKELTRRAMVPRPLTGAYLDLMGLGTSKMGVTPLNQQLAQVVLENASSPYSFQDNVPEEMEGFSVEPLEQRYMGLRPKQDLFFIYPNAGGNESYLYGHEESHANQLTPNYGVGNGGYMPTRNPAYQDESTPGGRENWLVENYRKRGVSGDRTLQERLASMRGQRRREADNKLYRYSPPTGGD